MPPRPEDSSFPDWAVAQASAALKIGLSVPEIEQRLVAKGLPPMTAAAVVNAVLEGRLQASAAPSEPSDGALTAHRVASVVVVCICLGLAYAFGGRPSVGRAVLSVFPAVVYIWWAEMLAAGSDPEVARWAAWVLLLLIVGYRVVLLLVV